MQKITGIKSVDFKITAVGHGVVNWNGPTSLRGNNGNEVENHTMPKLRGYTNISGRVKEENGYKYKKDATDIDLEKNPLYVSQNCARHHLFKEQAYDLHFANAKNVRELLASPLGLIRGYVIPASQYKRKSPLYLEDLVDTLGNGNFEQLGKSGSKDKTKNEKGDDVASNTFFSKTTFGDTEYVGYGSINIEELQFIPMDNKFDRGAMVIDEGDGEAVAKEVESFIKALDPSAENASAIFSANYVRRGSIFKIGEMGILLNDDAIRVLVDYTLTLIDELKINQGKGYLYVDSVTVDYNDSNKMLRMKRHPSAAIGAKEKPFALYYEPMA